ncbi:hypothetical protein SKAU_G00067740 [Synaphobranchus kaupii]|uniref:Uncharacterized protein n=1 Tax=Synaphobranchus kaupii TaxID=118154 RepID=A0A9Q1G7B4_SYNKA|nr:hypothetical protein SKAU_G00067740 [Synaphobranchus kaupii]
MPSLTSQPECTNCICLSQRIAELEGRISVLYQIQADEQLIDSLVVATTTAGEENSTTLCPAAATPCQAEDPWHQLGAKPKAPVSSTPHQTEPWTAARGRKRRGRQRSRSPSWVLQTDNRFITLDELGDTSVVDCVHPPSSPVSLAAPRPLLSLPTSRQSLQQPLRSFITRPKPLFTPAPRVPSQPSIPTAARLFDAAPIDAQPSSTPLPEIHRMSTAFTGYFRSPT